jgi:hypothetical protein
MIFDNSKGRDKQDECCRTYLNPSAFYLLKIRKQFGISPSHAFAPRFVMLTTAKALRYGCEMDDYDPANSETYQMMVLIEKLATGQSMQNYTDEEVRLLAKMRDQKELILSILQEELGNAQPRNKQGREKIDNLIRVVEKFCE